MAKFVVITWAAFFFWREAGLDEREAGLHEDDEHGADDDPQQVGRFAESDDGVDLLGEGLTGDHQSGDERRRRDRRRCI